jgi:hypothetical protein
MCQITLLMNACRTEPFWLPALIAAYKPGLPWLILAFAGDVWITSVSCYLLRHKRNNYEQYVHSRPCLAHLLIDW